MIRGGTLPGRAAREETISTNAELGRRGEEAAAHWLNERGFRILDRNWRTGRLELDLVAERGGEVVFVEVKTRRPGPQPASEALSWRQRRALRRAAAAWMRHHPTGRAFRFDLLAVTWPARGQPRIELVPGILEDMDI